MLADINGNAASRLFADNSSLIRLIMKVTETRQMTYNTYTQIARFVYKLLMVSAVRLVISMISSIG